MCECANCFSGKLIIKQKRYAPQKHPHIRKFAHPQIRTFNAGLASCEDEMRLLRLRVTDSHGEIPVIRFNVRLKIFRDRCLQKILKFIPSSKIPALGNSN